MRRYSVALPATGFSLTELAIVLVIVGLLLGGMLVPLTAQRDIQSASETHRQLASINEALLGFAAANGRLPCPASPLAGAIGTEALTGVDCSNPWDGFLPAITLSIQPTDAQGYAIDSWGNRIRYAVTNKNSSAFTKLDGVKNLWTGGSLNPDIAVCNTASAINSPNTATANCTPANTLTSGAVALVLSHGKNGGSVPTSNDELANWPTPLAKDKVFVSASPSETFDDIVIWLSPNILYNRMITAGKLP